MGNTKKHTGSNGRTFSVYLSAIIVPSLGLGEKISMDFVWPCSGVWASAAGAQSLVDGSNLEGGRSTSRQGFRESRKQPSGSCYCFGSIVLFSRACLSRLAAEYE